MRAYWDGTQFLSRLGNRYHAPEWFTAGLPPFPLDGELWLGRKQFQRTVSIVRRQDQTAQWREIHYRIFDAPAVPAGFEGRLEVAAGLVAKHHPPYAIIHTNMRCQGAAQIRSELARIEAIGGEGLMLRQPGSLYAACRSSTLLKVKSFREAEAQVIGHQPGAGRHRGRLGALLVEFPGGVQFAVGTGLSDRQRENPPPIGSAISFRFQELTDAGIPRFPVYVGPRGDLPIPSVQQQEAYMAETTSVKRRFEFVEGSSDKFWEVEREQQEVRVRFGRNGTQGQTNIKTFPDVEAAEKHVAKLVKEKTGKGYREVP